MDIALRHCGLKGHWQHELHCQLLALLTGSAVEHALIAMQCSNCHIYVYLVYLLWVGAALMLQSIMLQSMQS